MKLSESIALHTPATRRVLKAGGVGSGPQLSVIQREIAQRMANHLKVVTVHTPSQSRFSPTPKLATPAKVGHSGSAPKASGGGPKITKSAPRPGGKIGAGGPGSGRHPWGHAAGALAKKGFRAKGLRRDNTIGETSYQHAHPSKGTVLIDPHGEGWVHKGTGGETIAFGKNEQSLLKHLGGRAKE